MIEIKREEDAGVQDAKKKALGCRKAERMTLEWSYKTLSDNIQGLWIQNSREMNFENTYKF